MIKTKTPDVRSMLLTLGVPSYLTDIVIPYVWFIPGAVDPDSASIIEINRAMQRGLRAAGFKNVMVNGVLDKRTASALYQVSGSAWMEKAFVQILGDIIAAAEDPERHINGGISPALAGYFEYEGVPPGPLPGYKVGTPPGPWSNPSTMAMGEVPLLSGIKDAWDKLMGGGTAAVGGVSVSSGVNTGLVFGQGSSNKANIVPIPKKSGFTYGAFVNLQRQINRLLSKVGGQISEDGIIGPGTFVAFQKAQGVVGQSISGDSNTLQFAGHAVSIGTKLKQVADSMGIPANANKGSSSSSASAMEPQPQVPVKPPSDTMVAVKRYAPFLALAAGVAWFAKQQKKGKGKR